jgi:flagellar hook-associated protein 1 FlgK
VQEAESSRDGEAGVNLDEEAARLLQFQQAYQASARILQVAQATFTELLGSIR